MILKYTDNKGCEHLLVVSEDDEWCALKECFENGADVVENVETGEKHHIDNYPYILMD